MKTEVEARFSARDAAPLDDLADRRTLGHATLGDPMTFAEVDRYLDTVDGRLAKSRWACRLRTRGDDTRLSLKGPPIESPQDRSAGWRHHRPEVEGPASPAIDPETWPESAALELLDGLRGGGGLQEQLRFEQERTERAVSLAPAGRIGTLTLDRVGMSTGGRDLGRLHVVELELDEPSDVGLAALDMLAAELATVPGLEAEPRSKLEHALERIAAER